MAGNNCIYVNMDERWVTHKKIIGTPQENHRKFTGNAYEIKGEMEWPWNTVNGNEIT